MTAGRQTTTDTVLHTAHILAVCVDVVETIMNELGGDDLDNSVVFDSATSSAIIVPAIMDRLKETDKAASVI